MSDPRRLADKAPGQDRQNAAPVLVLLALVTLARIWSAIALSGRQSVSSPYVYLELSVVVMVSAGLLLSGVRGAARVPLWLAAMAAALAATWLEGKSRGWQSPWLVFNMAPGPGAGPPLSYKWAAILSALSVLLVILVASMLFAAVAPRRVRPGPVAALLTAAAAVVWFCSAVMPYQLPDDFHHGIEAQFRIVHIRKSGLGLQETTISVFRDGKVFVSRSGRRLFQYEWPVATTFAATGTDLRERALEFARSPQVAQVRTPRPGPLRAWNAEAWYVLFAGRLATFRDDFGLAVPRELVELAAQLESRPVIDRLPPGSRRDVCLGFCYDAPAALGYAYSNRACRTTADGGTLCE